MSEQLQLRRGTSTQVAAFTGAQGETVMDTTNNRLVVNDGSTAGGWPAAKLAEVLTNGRTKISDVAYTALVTDRAVAYTTLTAARVVTLPSASTYPTGTRLLFVDETGNCSTTKTLTITPSGTDTINGAASAVVNEPYGFIGVENNGVGAWTVVDQGFMPLLANVAAAAHGANIQIGLLETLVTLSGASTNASVQIPANCIVLAVGARVVAAITGATSYEVGVSGNLSQFGSGLSLAAGSTNFGVIGPTAFYAATTLTITATAALSAAARSDFRSRTCWPIRRRHNADPPSTEAPLMNRIILAALVATGVAASAQAQTYQDSGGTVVPGVVPIQPGVGPLFTSANPGKISGSFSASLSGFQPTPSYASLSVGATSSRVALPSGTVVVVYNTGTNAAYVTIGGAGVTATTSNDYVPAGGWMAFAVGSNAYLAGIETAGATTLNLSGGSGLPTGACCAAGGAGGGSNASVGSTGSAVPASATLSGMSVGGTMTAVPGTANGLKTDGSAVTQPVSAASLPLPTGAATAANQPTLNGDGGALAHVTNFPATQPVSAASLPLPSGAATAANQTSWEGATGSAAPGNASYSGARAENAEPSPAANGNLTGLAVGLEGKLITLPFANKENMVRGTASQTGTTATTLIAAQGSGVKIYITGVQCKNTGSATTIVTLNDNETTGSGTVLIVPTSGGDNEVYQTPLAVAANTALTFTPSAASSTIFCNAQGYAGS